MQIEAGLLKEHRETTFPAIHRATTTGKPTDKFDQEEFAQYVACSERIGHMEDLIESSKAGPEKLGINFQNRDSVFCDTTYKYPDSD